jgi:membrane protein implicated in regulation of membrane protease activity
MANYRDDVHEAVVTISICPGKTGQVKFQGSWWNARCTREVTLMPGQTVYVVSRQGNTLYVEPGFMLRAMMPMLSTIAQANQESV